MEEDTVGDRFYYVDMCDLCGLRDRNPLLLDSLGPQDNLRRQFVVHTWELLFYVCCSAIRNCNLSTMEWAI